jgi:site-specific DNA-methyltransferase (adenine-specific)
VRLKNPNGLGVLQLHGRLVLRRLQVRRGLGQTASARLLHKLHGELRLRLLCLLLGLPHLLREGVRRLGGAVLPRDSRGLFERRLGLSALDRLWPQCERVIRGNGAMVFTASQPFAAALVASRMKLFRYEWIWDKENAANFANARRQPLKQHESVLVFARGQTPYYPIKTPGRKNHGQGKGTVNVAETRLIFERGPDDLSGMKYPKSILYFPKHSSQSKHHPTQKPVELMDYLIRTYTQPGENVLDPCTGSGTTLVAARLSGRRAVGIETEEK